MDKKDWIEWLSSFSIHYITSYINLGDHSLFSKFIRHKKPQKQHQICNLLKHASPASPSGLGFTTTS